MPIIRPAHQMARYKGKGIFDGIKNIFGSIGRVLGNLLGSAKTKAISVGKEIAPQLLPAILPQLTSGLSQVIAGNDPAEVLRNRASLALKSGVDLARPAAQRSVRELIQQAKKEVDKEKELSDLKQIIKKGLSQRSQSQRSQSQKGGNQIPVANLLSKIMDRQKIKGKGIAQL